MNRVIAMSRLGRMGRFGNQLIQYAFLRCYALDHELTVQTPPWVGWELFGLRDEAPNPILPERAERKAAGEYSPAEPPAGGEFLGCDFVGYAQWHTSWYGRHKATIRNIYTPLARHRSRLAAAIGKLREGAATVVGLHIRLTDYGRLIYHRTPLAWYRRWLAEHWSRLDKPRLLVVSDESPPVGALVEWSAVMPESLGVEYLDERLPHYKYLEADVRLQGTRALDVWADHWLLQHCDVILMGNSTYPLTAAWLAKPGVECWRSKLSLAGFERIDPWSCAVANTELVENYPELEDIRLRENPDYWQHG